MAHACLLHPSKVPSRFICDGLACPVVLRYNFLGALQESEG